MCTPTANGFKVTKYVLIGFTCLFVVLTLISVLSGIWVKNSNGIFRICIRATNEEVIGGPGEPGGMLVRGMVNMSYDNDVISYMFYIDPSYNSSAITAVSLRGPIQPGMSTGVIALAFCGYPSQSNSCGTTINGVVWGTNTVVYSDAAPVTPTDIDPLIVAVRDAPYLYYIEFLTNAVPVTPGAARWDIIGACGTAI
jgi:hypothetical protein